MSVLWKSQQIGYEDVPLAMDEIARSEKESRLAGRVVGAVLILANLIGLSVMVVVAQWCMPTVNPVVTVVVASAAYIVGVIGIGIEKLFRKLRRMEMHALRLHDELLCVKEKIEDLERMPERKRCTVFD